MNIMKETPAAGPFKILFLHEGSEVSGAENSLIKLAEGLDKSKFEPIFITSAKGPFSRKLRESGIEVILIDFPKIRRVLGTYRIVKAIYRIAKEKKIALIHSNSIRPNIYASVSGRLAGIPVIWHQRNLITNEFFDPDRVFDFMPDAIICNSYAIARRFLRMNRLPPKVRVVHNGVDIEEFSPASSGVEIRKKFNINAGEIVVGIASRFHKYKGHEIFFEAAKIILTSMPEVGGNIRFLIAGGAVFPEDKWRERYLMDLAEKFRIGNKVVFAGFCNDMPEVYSAMDIFVLTSYAEPCGRVIFEAMACAKPVIATDSGGTPEIVADEITGYLVKPKDAAMLADKIAFFAKNTGIARKFGEAGRKRIEANFDIKSNVKKIEEIYTELIQAGSRA